MTRKKKPTRDLIPEPIKPQPPNDGLKIHADELEDVVAIAAKLHATANLDGDDTFEGREIDVIADTTGLSREELAQAQTLLHAKRTRRRAWALGGVAAIALAALLTKGLWWERVFPPDYKALALESVELTEQATLRRTEKQLDDSFELAKRAVEKDPKNFKAWNLVGLGYQDQKKRWDARDAYIQGIHAAGIRREAVELYYHMGCLLDEKISTRDDAVGYFQKAIACDPAYAATYGKLGHTFETLHRYDEAIKTYQAGLKYDAEAPALQARLTQLIQRTGKTPGAPTQAKMGDLSTKLKAVEARDAIDRLYDEEHKPKAAIAYGLKAVLEFPNDPQVWNALGLAYEEDGQKLEAAKCFTRATEVGGMTHEASYPYYNLGRLASETSDDKAAIAYLRKALQCWPNHGWSHYYMAKALERQGQRQEALDQYKAALRCDPTLAQAQRGIDRLNGK